MSQLHVRPLVIHLSDCPERVNLVNEGLCVKEWNIHPVLGH